MNKYDISITISIEWEWTFVSVGDWCKAPPIITYAIEV